MTSIDCYVHCSYFRQIQTAMILSFVLNLIECSNASESKAIVRDGHTFFLIHNFQKKNLKALENSIKCI